MSEKQLHIKIFHRRNQQRFTKFREVFILDKMIIMKKIDYLLKLPILKIISIKIIAYVLMVATLKMVIKKAQKSLTKSYSHLF